MKLAVAGTGYVGLVTAVCLAERGHDVTCVDIDEKKISLMKNGKSPIYEPELEDLMHKNSSRLHFTVDYSAAYKNAEVIFIGVGTPEQEDGTANLTYVRTVAKQIAESIENDCVVVVKSTVPLGTNDEVEKSIRENLSHKVIVHVASNPEFLSQGRAVEDTLHAKRIVIGVEDKKAEETLIKVYEPFELPIVITSRRSAEMIKYACNDFLALKISYINEIANLCEKVGANIDDVVRGMSYDPRIGNKFLHPGIGFGGSCFPKDTKALYFMAKNNYGIEMRTVKAAIDVNSTQRTRLFYDARQKYGSFDGKTIAVLGLTFKPNTDDLREAPSIDMVSLLLKDGAKINVYDPVGEENFKKIHKEDVQYFSTPEEAFKKASIVFVLTDWEQIKTADFSGKIVFDGRNCVNNFAVCEYYKSIGR
jgi:UDPglucose 6-dehydrogenase